MMTGNSNPRSGPNIHLLYSEIDNEKRYHAKIEKTMGLLLAGNKCVKAIIGSENL